MTVASASFYDRSAAQMIALSKSEDTLNTQIATGKKLQAPSDDALAYSRLRGLATQTADATAYGGNLAIAASTLSSADTALTSITAQLTRASELAVQANNGTLSADNRRAIGEELAGIVQTIASLANGKDAQGQPLFGDTSGGTAVTQNADGSYAFAAGTAPTIPIGDGQSIASSVTAAKVFTFGGTDALKVIGDLAATLQGGGALGSAASDAITDLQTAANQVNTAQASVGARAARVELEQSSQTAAATTRETLRSGLEDTDVTAAITELQKTMTTLQATQASFTKLSSLSLFDYLK
ncbi:flagellin [Sphingomonas bacterium]|uniref:flagellin N-terminal helical domain-containing protein n=1 Tax=Sphingomonas bacterium TaxID=1895847 RepID=UPI0015753374|nr:flagellin [Sphingomonas bacterium]